MNTLTSADHRSPSAWLADVPIRMKLAINALVPFVLLCAFAGWLWQGLGGIHYELRDNMSAKVDFALMAKEMQRNVVQVQQYLSDVSATRGQDGLDDGFKLAEENRTAFQEQVEKFRARFAAIDAKDERVQLDQVATHFDAYYQAGVQMAKAYVAGGPAQGNPLMGHFDSASEKLQESMERFVESETALMQQDIASIGGSTQLIQRLAAALCAAVAAFALLLGWLIAQSILRPVEVASHLAQRIANGDLRQRFIHTGRDELGQMLRAMGTMQAALRNLVSEVQQGVHGVNATSGEIAAANGDLSQRTEQQAAALQNTAAAMQMLGQSAMHNAQQADTARTLAGQAQEVALQCGRVVGEVVNTMQAINTSSRQVHDIVGVIDNIAFQTNILALNASVEAARAGELGRGFAVVAGEVRQLAGHSATAAREIKQLISNSVQEVSRGSEQVNSAGATMSEVVASIGRVSQLVQAINQAAAEQGGKVTEVAQSVAMIDDATQQNAALVEQTVATTEGLKGQAVKLTTAMGKFTLDAQPA
jgi:methyl-accepting chemotaxis protein